LYGKAYHSDTYRALGNASELPPGEKPAKYKWVRFVCQDNIELYGRFLICPYDSIEIALHEIDKKRLDFSEN
jgi:hypothetical protein